MSGLNVRICMWNGIKAVSIRYLMLLKISLLNVRLH
ncbi:hypothetical protein CoNPh26_CDS0140 [Staphylococcus phage S-CoN_Ph26]|nr:hypothetical protein CoNPh26_CDS0140 [Staphylococcus phage S-CoN_Ph26]